MSDIGDGDQPARRAKSMTEADQDDAEKISVNEPNSGGDAHVLGIESDEDVKSLKRSQSVPFMEKPETSDPRPSPDDPESVMTPPTPKEIPLQNRQRHQRHHFGLQLLCSCVTAETTTPRPEQPTVEEDEGPPKSPPTGRSRICSVQ